MITNIEFVNKLLDIYENYSNRYNSRPDQCYGSTVNGQYNFSCEGFVVYALKSYNLLDKNLVTEDFLKFTIDLTDNFDNELDVGELLFKQPRSIGILYWRQ